MIDMQPKQYARYRSADGRVHDMRHYGDDQEQFTDFDGVEWKRTALTEKPHGNRAHAVAELDRLEAAKPSGGAA